MKDIIKKRRKKEKKKGANCYTIYMKVKELGENPNSFSLCSNVF
jgi:hypothetical protein